MSGALALLSRLSSSPIAPPVLIVAWIYSIYRTLKLGLFQEAWTAAKKYERQVK